MCINKSNNHIDNLEIVTPFINTQRAWDDGLISPRGPNRKEGASCV